MKRFSAVLCGAAITVGVLAAIAALVAFGGLYNVAADMPHSGPVFALLQKVRETSIQVRANGVAVPNDLNSRQRIVEGGALYGEMCAQCHLGPGVEKTEISEGLYPSAPELAKGASLTAAEQFWVIKHGVKFTAMAAWGKTHNDTLIWNMVAFLRALPGLSAAQYQAMTINKEDDHDRIMRGMDMH